MPLSAKTETNNVSELEALRAFKLDAIMLLEQVHPVVKRQDYIDAKRVYDFIVKHKEK